MNRHYFYIFLLQIVLLCACEPEAKWTDKDIEVNISVKNISAAFIECDFSTNKDTYYLIAIEPIKKGIDPMAHQKQFMMLALDSANVEYIIWRNQLLQNGEFNIAPFSSHALRYGNTHHFFTGLDKDTDYWIYAFAVNPETLEPISKLHLMTVRTAKRSTMDVHFEYRVKGNWDYIYPVDGNGKIVTGFPYIATTRDSIELAEDTLLTPEIVSPTEYFIILLAGQFEYPDYSRIFYGVQAIENDGINSYLTFEEGHTYYTCIGGFDGNFRQIALYKFVWNGPKTNYYFNESDDANLINTIPQEDRWWELEY